MFNFIKRSRASNIPQSTDQPIFPISLKAEWLQPFLNRVALDLTSRNRAAAFA
jgi:hypothetical protein